MQSSQSLASLAEALALAQADVSSAFKSGENKFDKYRYAKYEDIAIAAKPVMAKHGLSVVFTADDLVPLDDRAVGAERSKFEHVVRIKVSARLLHRSGEWMESSAWGEGQDRADKAPYKAMTGAKKYLLAGLLGISTTDDPESDESVGRGDGDAPRHDRAPGSKPSSQEIPKGKGQARQSAAAATEKTSISAATAAPAAKAPTAPTTTGSATTAPTATKPNPTDAELRASKARADGASEFLRQGTAEKNKAASAVDIERIRMSFSRAAGATSRDQALEVIAVIAGDGITKPSDVPSHKVEPLLVALDQLAGIETES